VCQCSDESVARTVPCPTQDLSRLVPGSVINLDGGDSSWELENDYDDNDDDDDNDDAGRTAGCDGWLGS
jgi:hypothetical protein